MPVGRALHFVFKVGNRTETIKFFRDILGMKVLRHEEFETGCDAACNGPYDGKWSKTMIGYGSEDSHFVVELTYNYGVGGYSMGNDFQGITIKSKEVSNRVQCDTVEAPGGYKFHIINEDKPGDPVEKCSLSSSDLNKSYDYWVRLLGMCCYERSDMHLLLGYGDDQAKLELNLINGPVEHAKAFGRIAFSCQSSELPVLEKLIRGEGHTVLTPLISLDTPGKATVQVVILADPDGHEICFVGDEGFRELSRVDPLADDLLDKAIEADKSDEWYQKKNFKKDHV